MHSRSTIGFVAAVMAISFAGHATAQDQAAQSAEFPSYQMAGWSFTPALAAGVVYDSNVTISAPRGQGDTMISISPAAQIEFFGKRTQFSANYRGGLNRYVEVEGLDTFNQRGSVNFRYGWSRRLSIFANASYAESPTTDEIALNGVPFRRTGSEHTTLAAGSDFRITKFTSWSARFDTTVVRFEQPDVFLTDGHLHALRNEITHQLNARLRVGGEYAFRTSSVERDQTALQTGRNFTFHDAGGVVRFAFGPHTTGSAAGGFALLHDRTNVDTRTGPYFRLGLSHERERATVGVGYERHYVPSFGIGGTSSNQDIRGYVHMPLARNRIYTQISGGWSRSIPFVVGSLQLDTFSLRSIVGYAVARWARVEGVYGYTHQDTIVVGGELDRHRIGVQFVVSQPMRIR